MSGIVNRIPHFLKAVGSKDLMSLMLSNNLKDGKEYQYQIVYNSTEKSWYAWYYKEIDLKAKLKNRNN